MNNLPSRTMKEVSDEITKLSEARLAVDQGKLSLVKLCKEASRLLSLAEEEVGSVAENVGEMDDTDLSYQTGRLNRLMKALKEF